MHIILCHENADFDALAAMLAAHKLDPAAIPVLPNRLNSNVEAFFTLYRSALPFVSHDEFRPDGVEQITLVDTQRLPQVRGIKPEAPTHIIDHHPLARDLAPNETYSGERLGATTTLLVEQLRAQSVALTALEATLLALGIYEDTGSLTYGETHARDLLAAAWLIEQGAALDDVRRWLEPPLNEAQQALLERLIVNAETRSIQGYTVIVAAAELDTYLNEISAVAHRLRDTLDPQGLFLIVQMPGALHLVCRATDDAIDAGAIARSFGGGGHARTAAATLHDTTLDQAIAAIWQQLNETIQPAVRVADLMSHSARTLDANVKLESVVRKLRRIGHEGFPVVDKGQIVGLLTRRDADRAVEHGLGDLTIREVMSAGANTLRPDDPVALLEQRMVASGWGQIPVVDDSGAVLGIVTRTDLIQYWAQTHPAVKPVAAERVAPDQIADVLGSSAAKLIEVVAQQAQEQRVTLYMVGGGVRDLLLNRANDDIDFVVEADAIRFAQSLQTRYGGMIHSYRPFGTAKWLLSGVAINGGNLPEYVDFATARNEFYEHPTALPTVYSSSIKPDLGRRDFTINTLAVQLSPAGGRVIDYYGGLADLRAGLIRVLHSLSFVDDPTRILRAVRFERRLGFSIEPRTAELIETALPMLRRITGNRVHNELTLLLREPDPVGSFALLQQRGILQAIHPAFTIPDDLKARFERAHASLPAWVKPPLDPTDLDWCLLLADIPPDELTALLDHLIFSRPLTGAILDTARLTQNLDGLGEPETKPSQVVARLSGIDDLALYAAWIITDGLPQQRIWQYANEWRAVRSKINGHILRERGLKSGPCYAAILSRLRAARLDGEITTDAEEERLLQTLVDEGICNDGIE